MLIKISFFFLFILISVEGYCQSFFRFKADITIKVKNAEGIIQYTKGTVCYDKSIKKVLYAISFPEKEFYVSVDTLVYKFVNTKLISVQGNPLKPELSMFHFILNNDLPDFGLKNSSFKISNAEKSNGSIITKWIPPQSNNFPLGKILIATSDKKLQSVLIYNNKDELISRQVFKNYSFINGMQVPQEILTVGYFVNKKSYQMIEFSKVQINESGHDNDYDFKITQKLP
ncbi:MAG: hypothetical protein M1292_02945 [Bacteroidetes bacterium]|nr:hypothetical protein [Bacteroidota bacterium]